MSAEATLPGLLRRNAQTIPERTAIREKRLGIWQALSWRAYWQVVHRFASGLAAIGFRRGDKLAVIGDNRPRLYAAQLAAQCLGGIAVPVYQDFDRDRNRLRAGACRSRDHRRGRSGASR